MAAVVAIVPWLAPKFQVVLVQTLIVHLAGHFCNYSVSDGSKPSSCRALSVGTLALRSCVGRGWRSSSILATSWSLYHFLRGRLLSQ